MNFDQAKAKLLDLLRTQGKAKNSEMLDSLGGDEALFEQVREDLIFEDLAEDKKGVGLVYICPEDQEHQADVALGEGLPTSPEQPTEGLLDAAADQSEGEVRSKTGAGSGDPRTAAKGPKKAKLFLSYGRRDAKELADRLSVDLAAHGYEVWQDTRQIRAGSQWQQEIEDGLRSTQLVVALLSPHAVRQRSDPENPDNLDSVCLDEISFARFARPPKPIVPAMAQPCEPPFCIYRLDYVDLTAWSRSEDQYRAGLERLLGGIEAALEGRQPLRSWVHRLKPLEFDSYLNEKRRDFTGREWLLEQIDAWRHAHREPALLITGDPGVGKSAVVAQLVHLNPGGQLLAYHCCMADTPDTLRPSQFVQSLAAMIGSRLDDYAAMLETADLQEILSDDSCITDPASALERGVLAPLERLPAPEEGVRYILIDALDEALALSDPGLNLVELLATRLNRLPGWLRIVATTRKDPEVLRRLSSLRAETLDAQDPRNLDDVDAYVARRLETPNLAERLAASRVSMGNVQRRLREAGSGNFLYVKQALEDVERDNYHFDRLDELPQGLRGLYDDFFKRHFGRDENYAASRALLEVVVAAREPLTAHELAAASELDEEYELSDVMRRLATFVPERDGRYAVYHKSLADWLTEQDNKYRASPKRGHGRLAEMSFGQYQQGSPSSYALRHLPAHLTVAGQWDRLAGVLTDLTFLEAKTAAGRVFELAGDFTAAVDAMPQEHSQYRILKLLDEAVRRDIHFIARHANNYPQALFQCLWNSCWWYDCPEAAKHYVEHAASVQTERQAGNSSPGEQGAKLYELLERWRDQKQQSAAGFPWLRSLRPPAMHLGTAQLAVLRGHEGRVRSVSYSPDGTRIASGSDDKTVRVWDAASGAELLCLRGHEGWVRSVSYSPDGTRIASGGSTDKTVRVWDAASGAELLCLRGHEGCVESVSYSPDGTRIASGGGSLDKTVRVWDAASGAELLCLRGHEGWVRSVSYSPDGTRIASGSDDKTVRVWDAASGAELLCLRGHEGWVRSVSYSPDGTRIASGSDDKTVRVWDAASGAELLCLRGHEGWVRSVSYSPDGTRIASGSDHKTVRVWDAASGAELLCLRGHEGWVTSVSYSPDGTRIASGSLDKTVRVWDAASGAELLCLRGHEGPVRSVSYSPDGTRIASGSLDKTVRVWDAASGAELLCLRGHEGPVTSVSYSPDGTRIASGGSTDKTVRVWDAESGECLEVIEGEGDVTGIARNIGRVATGDDAPTCWAINRGQEMVVEHAASGQPVAWFPAALWPITTSPTDNQWAGGVVNYLCMIKLEGSPLTVGKGDSPADAHLLVQDSD